MSYCQELCAEGSRGALLYPEPILEGHALHDLGPVMRSPQPLPPLGRTLLQFEHHREHCDPGEASARLIGACAHGGKRRCDRLGRANVAPGLSGAIIEGPYHRAILGQALGRLGILRFLGGDAQGQRQSRPLALWGHPDRLQAVLGLRLQVLGQFVSDLDRLRHPTPLPTRLPVHWAQCLPAPQCPIPNGPGWRLPKSAAFEVQQERLPGLRTLAVAIPESDERCVACRVRTNNDENAMPRVIEPGVTIHAIDPEVML